MAPTMHLMYFGRIYVTRLLKNLRCRRASRPFRRERSRRIVRGIRNCRGADREAVGGSRANERPRTGRKSKSPGAILVSFVLGSARFLDLLRGAHHRPPAFYEPRLRRSGAGPLR